ncbi:MAG: helix-turn-helix domain-containing protein [Ruminococcaceae bacterium]|nr:helix-turn-helix domain-containing protein [Oscillospiraceae bacterium]
MKYKNGEITMINIDKLLESKRIEVKIPNIKIDKYYVKQFRINNKLTQIALANILGVTKKTIEKWEQGTNNINGSSAVLLRLLNDNPDLLSQLYSVKVVKGKDDENEYQTIESKVITLTPKNSKKIPVAHLPFVAMI